MADDILEESWAKHAPIAAMRSVGKSDCCSEKVQTWRRASERSKRIQRRAIAAKGLHATKGDSTGHCLEPYEGGKANRRRPEQATVDVLRMRLADLVDWFQWEELHLISAALTAIARRRLFGVDKACIK